MNNGGFEFLCHKERKIVFGELEGKNTSGFDRVENL